MLSVQRVVKPSLQKSYAVRNSLSGNFREVMRGQGAVGKSHSEMERSWLVAKGATATGKNTSELWDSYLISKGFTTGTLKDRMKSFFSTGTQA